MTLPGKEYTVKGRLVYKEDHVDGLCFFHEAGEEIAKQSYSFLADSEEKEIVLSFEIDSVQLEGTCVVAFEDLKACGTMANAKAKGLFRLEGKEYVMKDGDIVNFLFNV